MRKTQKSDNFCKNHTNVIKNLTIVLTCRTQKGQIVVIKHNMIRMNELFLIKAMNCMCNQFHFHDNRPILTQKT